MLENRFPVHSPPKQQKKKKKKTSLMHRWRRVTQFSFLFALNPWFTANLGFCFPVMNCWACPAAAFGCPIGAIGEFLALGLIPFLSVGLLILAGALFGRMLCGWVCPFGLIQDLMARIPIPFVKKKPRFPAALSWAKYVFLIGCVLWVPLQFGIRKGEEQIEGGDFFFCHICPAGTLEAAIPVKLGFERRVEEEEDGTEEGDELADAGVEADSIDPVAIGAGEDDPFAEDGGAMGMEDDPFGDSSTGAMDLFDEEEGDGGAAVAGVAGGAITGDGEGTDWAAFLLKTRMWILYAFLAMFILFRRPFCRGMCPIGAVFAILNKVSFLRLRVDKDNCKDCNLCAKVCPAGNRLCDSPSNQDCVRCLECISVCKLDAAKVGIIKPEKQESFWE